MSAKREAFAGRESLAFLVAAVVATAMAAACVLLVPYLPTNDGPAHVLAGWWWNHLETPGQLWARAVVPVWPRSGVAFHLPFVTLEPLLGWRVATQVIVLATVLLHAWGTVALARVVHGRWHWPSLLGFVVAFGWPLYMGFFNFALATAVAIWLLALVVRVGGARPSVALWLLPCMALVAWLHLFAALALGAALGIYTLCDERRGRGLLWLAVSSVPVALIVLSTMQGTMHPTWHSLADLLPGAHAWSRAEVLAKTILPGPWWRSELVVVALLVGAVAAVRRRDGSAWVGVVALLSLAAATFAPFNFPGWQGFAPRFAVIGVACAAVATPWPRRAEPVLATLLVAFTMVATGSIASFNWRLWAAYSPVLEGIAAAAPSNGYRTFVQLEPIVENEAAADAPVVLARYGIQTPAIYVLAQGGIARVFHSLSLSPIELFAPAGREFPQPLTSDGVRFGALVERVASGAATDAERDELRLLHRHLVHVLASYDDAIVFGAPALRDVLLARGFESTFAGSHVALVRHVGCSASFEFGARLSRPMRAVASIFVGPEPALAFRDGLTFELPAQQPGFAMTEVPCLQDVRVTVLVGDQADADALRCEFRGDVTEAVTSVRCVAASER